MGWVKKMEFVFRELARLGGVFGPGDHLGRTVFLYPTRGPGTITLCRRVGSNHTRRAHPAAGRMATGSVASAERSHVGGVRLRGARVRRAVLGNLDRGTLDQLLPCRNPHGRRA